MIDAFAIDPPAPPALVQPARKRGSSRTRHERGTPRPSRSWTAYTIGALVILSNGERCEIIARSAESWICETDAGRWWSFDR